MVNLQIFYEDYGIPLNSIRNGLINDSRKIGLPLSIRYGECLTGANIGPASLPCMILEHPNHTSDYFSFCVAPNKGNYSGDDGYFVYFSGISKQLQKVNYNANITGSNGSGWLVAGLGALRGGSTGVGAAIGGIAYEAGYGAMVGSKKLFNSLTLDKRALEQELWWYNQVKALLESTMGI
jgi:hypothetical protein